MNEGMTMPYIDLVPHSLIRSFSSVTSYELHIISTEEKTETLSREDLAKDYRGYEWRRYSSTPISWLFHSNTMMGQSFLVLWQ